MNVRRSSTGRAWSTAIAAALLMSVSACGGTTATDQASDNRGSDDDTAGSSTTDAASSEPEPLFADEFDTSGPVDRHAWRPILATRPAARQRITQPTPGAGRADGHSRHARAVPECSRLLQGELEGRLVSRAHAREPLVVGLAGMGDPLQAGDDRPHAHVRRNTMPCPPSG